MDTINPTEEQLLELVRQCTVKLVVPNGHGTGFFVTPDKILTCAHVVEAAQKTDKQVKAYWNNTSYTVTIEYFLSEFHPGLQLQYPDLALLQADELAIVNHPCAYLHTDAHLDDSIYSYGYTDEYPTGDPSTYKVEGWTDERHLLLKLKEGQGRSGLSGAPVLNRRTGGVCGIMKRSRNTESDLGGRAIPTQTIFRALLEKQVDLNDLQLKFHKQNSRWYECLTQLQRELLGLVPLSDGIEIFILFADVDEDRKFVNKLERHLASMQKQRLITTWNIGKLISGSDEQAEITAHMNRAKIILLIVSDDFMSQHYLDNDGLEQAMEKRKTGTVVIPIYYRPTEFQGAPFEGLSSLPTNRKWVIDWTNIDSALFDVTKGIRRVVEGMKKANA